MCDSDNHQGYIADTSFTRRSVVLTISSAAAVAALPTSALAAEVIETDVMVPTPDGSADAALFHPAGSGSWPAVLMARGVNCLVLDEPTNHLDLPAIEQLEHALEGYDGTLVLVTHDRRLLDAVRIDRTITLG